jgi:peptidyl-prolyl cis-trans isomerase C
MPNRLTVLRLVPLACVACATAVILCSPAARANPTPSAASPHVDRVRSARAPTTPQEPPSAEAVARRALVVATFQGGQITAGELEDAILNQNPFMQQRYLSTDAVRALLERSLRFELLAAEAERRGYGRGPAAVLAARQSAVQALIKQDFDDKITAESIPLADAKKYYAEHLDEFVRGEGRRVSLLLLADAAAAQKLLPEAQAADLRAFHELVRNHSVDASSKQRGGDLHFFNAQGRSLDDDTGKVDPALAKAAFALHAVGDTSAAVQVGERCAILRLTGIRPAQDESFERAEDRVRLRLWRERRQNAIDTFLGVLKQQHQVMVHPELVGAVKLEDGPPLPPSDGLPSGFPHTFEPVPQKSSPLPADPR